MIEAKLLEVRDSGTMMPVLAVKLHSDEEAEHWLLERAGYTQDGARGEPYILVTAIEPGSGVGAKAQFDPYEWYPSRTMQVAHLHMIAHWNELQTGSVIDIEYLLGRRAEPKQPERLTMRPR